MYNLTINGDQFQVELKAIETLKSTGRRIMFLAPDSEVSKVLLDLQQQTSEKQWKTQFNSEFDQSEFSMFFDKPWSVGCRPSGVDIMLTNEETAEVIPVYVPAILSKGIKCAELAA